ncbi:MAG: ABC transporter ATP-binding protein [Clostridia bacterium]|nr:ABC transporter ATP-binding protein [Clostridia bacterium]
MEYVFEADNISKSYSKKQVLKNISFHLKKGHIYGLIGPNGAGKTTVMRIMAGLNEPTGGTMQFFEKKGEDDFGRSRMSFILETPYIDGGMTAFENMQYIRYVRGVADESRINELLTFVGLGDVGKKPAKHFSLGMRQRLGIAMALLPSPEFVVLDEPFNGLDPEGFADLRNILHEMAEKDHITILISSHILKELSELCTDYIIIRNGEIIEMLSDRELQEKCRSYISIRTDDLNKTAAVLEDTLHIQNYKVVENDELHIFEEFDKLKKISRTITDNGLTIMKLVVEEGSLEEYYLSKVGGHNE